MHFSSNVKFLLEREFALIARKGRIWQKMSLIIECSVLFRSKFAKVAGNDAYMSKHFWLVYFKPIHADLKICIYLFLFI